MAISIGDAILFLSADDKQLKKGLKGAERTTADSTKKMGASVANLQNSFTSVTASVSRFQGLFSAATSGAVAMAVKHWANIGDEINKLSERTGVATEQWSRLRYAAGQMNTDTNELAKNFKFMTKTIEEGSAKTKAAVAQIGLSFEELKRADPLARFMMILQALSGIENESKRVALALQFFGKSGDNTLSLISQGMSNLQQTLADTPQIFTAEQAANADAMNDNITKLGENLQAAFFPLLSHLSKGFNEFFNDFDRFKEMSSWAFGYKKILDEQTETDKLSSATVREMLARNRNVQARKAQAAAGGPGVMNTSLSTPDQLAAQILADEQANIANGPGGRGRNSPFYAEGSAWLGADWQPTAAEAKAASRSGATNARDKMIRDIQLRQAPDVSGNTAYHPNPVRKTQSPAMQELGVNASGVTINYGNTFNISHGNFVAGDDMVRAYNRKQAMRPGI